MSAANAESGAYDSLYQFRRKTDQLRELRKKPAHDIQRERALLAELTDMFDRLNDHDQQVAATEGWRGWPDLYADRMGSGR